MAARKEAPDAVVVDELSPKKFLAIEEDFDKRFPAWKHMWKRLGVTAQELAVIHGEIVKEGNDEVTTGTMRLIRVPKDEWKKKRTAESDATYKIVKDLHNDDGKPMYGRTIRNFASPKKLNVQE